MTIVALTGGIAAGKSTISDRLAEHGVLIIDADQVAREVVAPGTETLAKISQRFGQEVVHPDGTLNREALGSVVFSDPAARQVLNDLVHPAVRHRSQELFEKAHRDHPDRVVVYAVPLVAEAKRRDEFDLVVLAHAPHELRIARLVEYRGMTESEAAARVDAQASDDERLAIADIVVDSSGERSNTLLAADQLATALKAHWPDNLATIPTRFPTDQS